MHWDAGWKQEIKSHLSLSLASSARSSQVDIAAAAAVEVEVEAKVKAVVYLVNYRWISELVARMSVSNQLAD